MKVEPHDFVAIARLNIESAEFICERKNLPLVEVEELPPVRRYKWPELEVQSSYLT